MASVAQIVDKIGNRASEASPLSTSQLCRVRAQPRAILPIDAPRDAAARCCVSGILGRRSGASALIGSPADRLIRTYDRSVGDLASIGYNGQPVRSPFRVVRPPITALVDLPVLFP